MRVNPHLTWLQPCIDVYEPLDCVSTVKSVPCVRACVCVCLCVCVCACT